jgi:hypothetical protein
MLVVLGWTLLTSLHAASSPIQRVTQQPSRHAEGGGSVSVWADREDPYRRGDDARIYLRTERPSHVTVLRVDTDGRIRVLFPREPWGRTRIAGDRTLEVTGPPDGRSFRVDDDPGVGYLLAVASPSPFNYDPITRGDHWDYRAMDGGRIQGDPYVVLAGLAQTIAPGRDYRYDIAPYYVERRYEYPRFVCYDCHSYASYDEWDPYAASCTRFRLVIYDDPSYYPYRYNSGRNVVVARPAHPAPRYVFEDAHSGTDFVTRLRGSIEQRSRADADRGRTSADVGGRGAVPAPGTVESPRRAVDLGRERDPWRRREPAVVAPSHPAEPEPRRDPVERGSRRPQSTGEPELRRRKPEQVKP